MLVRRSNKLEVLISPELISAVRLEWGLKSINEEHVASSEATAVDYSFFFFFIIAVDYSQKYQIKSWNELGICDKLSRIHRELHIVNLDNISWKQYNISSPNWRLFSNS